MYRGLLITLDIQSTWDPDTSGRLPTSQRATSDIGVTREAEDRIRVMRQSSTLES